jgi:Fe2+ or Zn2+ uptake regulation protein
VTNLQLRIDRALEDAGMRRTSQRFAVMQYLMEQPVHASAEEIFEAVNRLDPRASRATIYNSLNALVHAGLVRRLSLDVGGARYDAALDRHHHFFCERCGNIRDIPWFPVSRIAERAALGNHTLRDYDITLRGICGSCGASD